MRQRKMPMRFKKSGSFLRLIMAGGLLAVLSVCGQLSPTLLNGSGGEPEMQASSGTNQNIVMNREPLESPADMKIYEIKSQAAGNDFIQKNSPKFNFFSAPTISREGAILHEYYLDQSARFPRFLSDLPGVHMTLFPHLEKLSGAAVELPSDDEAMVKAADLVRSLKFVPEDGSRAEPVRVVTLSCTTVKAGRTPKTADFLKSVFFKRTIDGRPVLGTGSSLSVDIGHRGALAGFNISWDVLRPTKITPVFRKEKDIYAEIERFLLPHARGRAKVRVKKPDLIYYGDGSKYLQPAYFFSAEIEAAPGISYASIWGVVPAVKNFVELALAASYQTPRALPAYVTPQQRTELAPPVENGRPSVGCYIVRDDSRAWVDDANDFRSAFPRGQNGTKPAIVLGDYLWNYQSFWSWNKSDFVDRWSIVLAEGYSGPWFFTTRTNCCESVNLDKLGQIGFGDRSDAGMRFLILKGGPAIPAPPDRRDWVNSWWRLFKGLRMALGFRTAAYINDEVSGHFARHAAEGCRVLDTWFHVLDESLPYQVERLWGDHSENARGYGSVVMITGHEGDTIYELAAAPYASLAGLSIWFQH
jgi:hypothetical protein